MKNTKNWLFKKLFHRERQALIRNIEQREAIIRRHKRTIANLRAHNTQLNRQTRELMEVLQLKLNGIIRKSMTCTECGHVSDIELYYPPRNP